jgi:hypothetical protein
MGVLFGETSTTEEVGDGKCSRERGEQSELGSTVGIVN